MSKITIENLIDLNLPEFQAHGDVSPDYVREIAESIKIHGILQPLIVRNTDKGLEIVAGCIRYQAALLAGLKAVPCINMSLDSRCAEIVKLHENTKRVPLNHIDEGYTFLYMLDTFEMTEKDISECSGKSIPYISQHISLVRLKNELTSAVKDGSLTFYQARELMRVDDKHERKRLLNLCQESGVIVSVLREWVNKHLRTLEISPPHESSNLENSYVPESSKTFRICEACNNPIKTSEIMQAIFCPTCHHSILTAISEERQRLSSKTPEKDSQDTPS